MALANSTPKRLVSMIEVLGNVAGNDPDYNLLVERLADFVAKRSSEAEGATVLLKERSSSISLTGSTSSAFLERRHSG